MLDHMFKSDGKENTFHKIWKSSKWTIKTIKPINWSHDNTLKSNRIYTRYIK